MHANPTHQPTVADTLIARMRADTARAQLSPPQPDDPLTPAHPDWELLTDFLSPNHGLASLCEKHNIGPQALEAWLAKPTTQAALAAARRLTALRLSLLDLQATLAVRSALIHIISTPPPEDPRLLTRHLETTRKAATTLHRITTPATPHAANTTAAKPTRRRAPSNQPHTPVTATESAALNSAPSSTPIAITHPRTTVPLDHSRLTHNTTAPSHPLLSPLSTPSPFPHAA